MHRYSVDYLKDRDAIRKRGTLVDRGFWIHGIPRPLILCRTFGHKPVVDGTAGFRGEPGARWVCCDRCGVRPEPQGVLDPTQWDIGDRYNGPFDGVPHDYKTPTGQQILKANKARTTSSPGQWPDNPTWKFGGQAILGRTFTGLSAQVKIGNCGSEHTLAAHLRIDPLCALYLHTERLGTWLQRRLNPVGYDSRVIGVDITLGSIYWKLWAKRDGGEAQQPRWQAGSIKIDPRDKLLGRRRYWYTDEGEPVTATVRMPHGDDHEVTLQLQRQEFGREKLHRRKKAWTVDWDGVGIPTKPGGRGHITGSGVEVSDASVRKGMWPLEAAANIAKSITAMRTREGMVTADEAAA